MKARIFASPAVWSTSLLLAGCLMSHLSVNENAGEGAAGTDSSSAGNKTAGSSNGGAGAGDSGGSSNQGTSGDGVNAGTSQGGSAGTSQGGSAGTSQGGSAGEAPQGGGGAEGEAEPCSDPISCIDEVASADSDFGNPGWKDSWWVTGCNVKENYECFTSASAACKTTGPTEEQGSRTIETWQLGGEKGQHYKVTFKFNGVVEGKLHQSGTPDAVLPAPFADPYALHDMFYRDGESVNSNYETLKLTIFDDKGVELRHFYMNAGPAGWEQHATFLASYEKSIVVVGQGKIAHMVQDKNCRSVDNCGAGSIDDSSCPAPRKLPGDAANLLLPPKYRDTVDGTIKDTALLAKAIVGATREQPWRAHASHLKIVAIEKTSDGVEKNY